MMINRRFFIGGTLALGAGACIPPDQSPIGRLAAELRLIEAAGNGTLGVEIYNTVSGQSVGINRDRRFGHASSFKLSLAAMVLALDAQGKIDADRRVMWSAAELMNVSPFTTERLAAGATLRELARATQVTSDNAAANILLRELGGPAALTAFWRSLDDEVSRLDRTEPELNIVPPSRIPRHHHARRNGAHGGQAALRRCAARRRACGAQKLDDRHRNRPAPRACGTA